MRYFVNRVTKAVTISYTIPRGGLANWREVSEFEYILAKAEYEAME